MAWQQGAGAAYAPTERSSRTFRPPRKPGGLSLASGTLGRGTAHGLRVALLVFVSGAALMALEIVGSRVLAPFFGSSVFVWGSLTGIVVGAMSGGYRLGGWPSGRWPRRALLDALLATAGGIVLLLSLWAVPLCRAVAGGVGTVDLGPRLGPPAAALVLFAPPGLLLGTAPPFAVAR